jgi:hypothetical protein
VHPEYPDPGALADPDDTLGWDITRHGRMVQFTTPDDAVETVPYEPGADV